MSKLAGTGNVQELGRFTKAIGKSLDSAKEESDSIQLDEKEKKERAEKRKNVKLQLIFRSFNVFVVLRPLPTIKHGI